MLYDPMFSSRVNYSSLQRKLFGGADDVEYSKLIPDSIFYGI